MRFLGLQNIVMGICVIALAVSAKPPVGGLSANSACGNGLDLQIVTDKRVYAPSTTIKVEFLVTNMSDTPLYLFRSIDQCSSPLGSLSLRVRDPNNQEVPGLECAVDYLMDQLDPAQKLGDSKYGVLLRKDEIFGKWQEYEVPKEKGLYRLQGELVQVGFLTDDQEKALSQHQMRILRHTCSSPIVTIEVK